MKRIVFLIFLSTLLLFVGKTMNVNMLRISTNSVSKRNTFIDNQEKFSDLNPMYLLNKSTDFDFEEELSSNNDSKSDKVLQVKPSYFSKWYLSYEALLNDIYNKFSIYNSEYYTNLAIPIYITHNVLRI